MPFTAFDRMSALIVIDLQKGIAALPPAELAKPAIANAVRLIETFRSKGLPVVLVNVTGGAPGRAEWRRTGTPPADWAELLPDLGSVPSDIMITKKTWGAFTGTGLDDKLKGLGVTEVVICGIATSMGVESTARFAHELGYNVALPTDAMTDPNPEAHKRSVELVFAKIAETGSTDELLALLSV